MNFNSLPNETLQRIVDLCHEADEAYGKRRGDKPRDKQMKTVPLPTRRGKSIRKTVGRDRRDWRGRSCSAMSMANKRLREMAIKHIFTASLMFLLHSISQAYLDPLGHRLYGSLKLSKTSFSIQSSAPLPETALNASSSTIRLVTISPVSSARPALNFPSYAQSSDSTQTSRKTSA